jgi:hypothetical protein
MRKSILVGAAALVAVAVGAVYFTGDSTERRAATAPPAADKTTAPPDPKLAPLQVSPDNGSIKFIVGDNGKVIAEIDRDPKSASYGRPTREYLYFGDKIMALTEYRYVSDKVEITTKRISYKPDGSVDAVKESFQSTASR